MVSSVPFENSVKTEQVENVAVLHRLGDQRIGARPQRGGQPQIFLRRRLGIAGYWSLAGYAKRKVKSAVSFIYDFEDSVMHEARSRGVDGVICGHIHAVAQRTLDGLVYMNCGDWVDSCTAIVEHADGRFAIVDWGQELRAAGPRTALAVEEETAEA